jgi:hypothetical protein
VPECTGAETTFHGNFGKAELWVADPSRPDAAAAIATWLLTHPQGHPLWSQYLLGGVTLRELEGFPPPQKQFPEATHEIFVVALDPSRGPYTVETLNRFGGADPLPYMIPINIAHQFAGSDEDCRKLTAAAAYGVTGGMLWPETSDSPMRIRADWEAGLNLTLEHIKTGGHDADTPT